VVLMPGRRSGPLRRSRGSVEKLRTRICPPRGAVSRVTLIAAYGPPVPQLAYHVLAYSLAYSQLKNPPQAPKKTHEV